MASRGRRVAIVSVSAVVAALVVCAPLVWREAVAAYYLRRLRTDPGVLDAIADSGHRTAKDIAVRRFLAEPKGGAALVDLFAELSGMNGMESMDFRSIGDPAFQNGLGQSFVSFYDRALRNHPAPPSNRELVVASIAYIPQEREVWTRDWSDPTKIVTGTPLNVELFSHLTRWLRRIVGSRGHLQDGKVEFRVETLSTESSIPVVLLMYDRE